MADRNRKRTEEAPRETPAPAPPQPDPNPTVRVRLMEDMFGSKKGAVIELDVTSWTFVERLHRQGAIQYVKRP